MELHDYLTTLTEQIRCKKARPAVAEEISHHIKDQAEAYESQGLEHEEALAEAIRQMGDPVEAGTALDHIHRPRMEWGMLLLILILSAAGLAVQFVMCQSEGSYQALSSSQMMNFFFYKQCLYVALGLACMFIVYFLDYSLIGRYPLLLWFGYFILLFILSKTALIPQIYGQQRIYNLLTLFVPLYAGILFRFRNKGYGGLLACAFLCLLPLWMFMKSVQTTGFLEAGFIFLVMITFAVAKGWFRVPVRFTLVSLWSLALCIPFLLISSGAFLPAYQSARIYAWLHPVKYPETINYQRSIILKAVSEFRLVGSSSFPDDFLANWPFDYTVTLMYSTFGILIGTGILALILLLLIKALNMAVKQKNQLGAMVGLGCGMILLMQYLTYIASNFGVGLLTQKTIPFLSFGLQGTVLNYLLIGLLLSIYRFKDILPLQKAPLKPRYRIRIERVE